MAGNERTRRSSEETMKYFLCRFLLPRPDFLATMSDDEAKMLKAHGGYLQALLEKDMVVAHGPVLDPAGGWGVSIFEIEDHIDITALTADDPMIKAQVGAKYEALPMRQLRYRN
jgi:uncharacterized protein YciI